MVTQRVAAERRLDGVSIDGFLGSGGLPDQLVRSITRSPEILEQACMPDFGTQLDLDPDLTPVLDEPGPELARAGAGAPRPAAGRPGLPARVGSLPRR